MKVKINIEVEFDLSSEDCIYKTLDDNILILRNKNYDDPFLIEPMISRLDSENLRDILDGDYVYGMQIVEEAPFLQNIEVKQIYIEE